MFSGILQDFRIARRALARDRGFALIAILSLALGIGANTTIFSLVNALLLRPLPVRESSRLVTLFTVDAHNPGFWLNSYPNYRDYRDRNTVFSSLAICATASVNLSGHGEARRVMAQLVSANYFPTLGVIPSVGRAFLPEEDRQPQAVAVISYDLWMRLYHGNVAITSQSVTLNQMAYHIVGVAPKGFHGLEAVYAADVWAPFRMYEQLYPLPRLVEQRRFLGQTVVGRLKTGITAGQAAAQMDAVSSELEREYPIENPKRRVKLVPIDEATLNLNTTRPGMTKAGAVLLIVSGLVLLIACANVASLLLARAAARRRETAIRLAVGAGRWRVVRLFLVFNVFLSLAGGLAGLACAQWTRELLWSMRPANFKYAAALPPLDATVLAYNLAVAVLTGLLFGLVPALASAKPDLATDLKERTGEPAYTNGMWNPRSILVVAQVAFSLVALVGAGLFVRSLRNAGAIDPGFDAAHLATIDFNMADVAYDEARGREFRRRAVETAAATPGVDSVSMSQDPFFKVSLQRFVLLGGRDNQGSGRPTLTSLTWAGYFRTARIALLQGRDFGMEDDQTAPHAAIVNETAAKLFWPGEDGVGKSLQFVGDPIPAQVIGVARTVSYKGLGDPPQPVIYLAMQQVYRPVVVLTIHTPGDPDAAAAAVRRTLQKMEPNLPLDAQSVRTTMGDLLWAQRILANLLGAFGLLALALAIVGIYGVVSYNVSQRAREIGVRMAMGATEADVEAMILAQGMRLVGLGLAIGMAIALVSSQLVEKLLLVVGPRDAVTFILVPAILWLVSVAACWFPAHRAARIDPAAALRRE
ncbi:MAG TPA: ABC transporter permease [Bryobacteraceae bacterium]|nr:ABC transporter permease [Bryobacteraceae bacterium]